MAGRFFCRKKPLTVEGEQFSEAEFKFSGYLPEFMFEREGEFFIKVRGEDQKVFDQDFVLKDSSGEWYPCPNKVFAETYDKLSVSV